MNKVNYNKIEETDNFYVGFNSDVEDINLQYAVIFKKYNTVETTAASYTQILFYLVEAEQSLDPVRTLLETVKNKPDAEFPTHPAQTANPPTLN